MKIKALISRNTIVLHPSEGQPININKENDEFLFAEVSDIINNGTVEQLTEKFFDIKQKIEKYSLKLFTVDSNKGHMYLKGDDMPMPEIIVDKLLELEKEGEDFMPLIRFWKKLKTNPSKASIEQLYGFMVHNGIGLTEDGDIVVEKGVSSIDGNLFDTYTKTINNNIGEVVEMDRNKVNPDSNTTCSYGLHVGAPQYVRDFYNTGVIVKCTVNPRDVVAVPIDYNNTKMRVCRYKVVGFSDIHLDAKPVYKLSDFVSKEEVIETTNYEEKAEKELEGLTANQILDYIEDLTGERMPYNPKSKRTIVKRGIEILSKYLETVE